MAKFIELDQFDIVRGVIAGKRSLDIDKIKELAGPYRLGNFNVVCVCLVGNNFVDVVGTLEQIKEKIDSL